MGAKVLHSTLGGILAAIVTAPPVFAQDPLSDLAREVAALRAEVRDLRARLEAPPAAPPTTLDILQTQVAELAQTSVESESKLPVRLFGTLHSDVFANSGNANWLENPNIVGAVPADGHNGTMSATLRQTRIGFAANGPAIGAAHTSAVVAFDFFGGIPGFQTGQVMGLPRLLVGYARIEGAHTALEAGQDHAILAPRDPTSLAAYSFPLLFRSGNLYLRAPQVRIEQKWASGLNATAGIVAPIGGDLVGDGYLFVPPALGGERSQRPGVQARIAFARGDTAAPNRVDAGLSGHLGWERRADGLTRSWAAAVDLAARRQYVGIAGEAFAGDNIDAFGGGLGLDARAAGGWGEVQLFPSDRVTLTAGGGIDEIRGARQVTLPRGRNRSAYGSVIFSLTPEVQTSFEYRHLSTLAGGSNRPNHHFDWVLIHRW
jgi:hypothetical protein